MDQGSNKDNHKKEDKFANVDELPETEAFQDEFTREFLVSTEEVEEGYYLFESKTGGYRMLFPVNAIVNGGGFYSKNEENTLERIGISGWNERENVNYSIKINYENRKLTNDIQFNLDYLSDLYDYEGEFIEYEVNGNKIYFGEYILENKEILEESYFYAFIGYIKSLETDKAISISYISRCRDKTLECSIDQEIEKKHAKKFLNLSIFRNNELVFIRVCLIYIFVNKSEIIRLSCIDAM